MFKQPLIKIISLKYTKQIDKNTKNIITILK